MSTGVRVIMLGRQGAGKGTQCRRVAEHYGIPHISTGEILRNAVRLGTVVGRQVKKVIDEGRLVEDNLMVSLVQGRIGETDARVDGYVLDGFPRTLAQAEAFDELTEVRPVNVVIDLEVQRDVVLQRLSARRTCQRCDVNFVSTGDDPNPWICQNCGGVVHQRDDDTPLAINHRLDIYDEITAPLVDYYRKTAKLVVVDGLGSQDEVFAKLLATVEAWR
ncbi:MAG: adenylate kinase [Ilumatobacteraceae bacterium]